MQYLDLTNCLRPIGLLKMYLTRTGQETATDAVQVFGGRGITKTGMGSLIEHVRLRRSSFIHYVWANET
jgi:alkylation response protein AidB-like acyl-CoA dehydrogenase